MCSLHDFRPYASRVSRVFDFSSRRIFSVADCKTKKGERVLAKNCQKIFRCKRKPWKEREKKEEWIKNKMKRVYLFSVQSDVFAYSEVSNKSRVLITCRKEIFPKSNKRGGSNKACSWEIFLKKNKKNSMLIRDFRVLVIKYSLLAGQEG